MGPCSRVTLTLACLIGMTTAVWAKPAARPPVATAHNPVANVRAPLQIQTGPKPQPAAQSFKGLQLQVTPHRPEGAATPVPASTPEFNPLKRRHMAMPVVPEPDLAF